MLLMVLVVALVLLVLPVVLVLVVLPQMAVLPLSIVPLLPRCSRGLSLSTRTRTSRQAHRPQQPRQVAEAVGVAGWQLPQPTRRPDLLR